MILISCQIDPRLQQCPTKVFVHLLMFCSVSTLDTATYKIFISFHAKSTNIFQELLVGPGVNFHTLGFGLTANTPGLDLPD